MSPASSTAAAVGRYDNHVQSGVGMEVFPGVTMDPAVRFGKPCLAGTRVDVATVVGSLAAGEPIDAVGEAYGLTREQVLTALRYAAFVASHLPPAVSEVS